MEINRDALSPHPIKRNGGDVRARQGLLDVAQAAEFLAVTVSTLYGWVWQRRIPFVKLGRALRFDIADLQSFVDRNRVDARRNHQP